MVIIDASDDKFIETNTDKTFYLNLRDYLVKDAADIMWIIVSMQCVLSQQVLLISKRPRDAKPQRVT